MKYVEKADIFSSLLRLNLKSSVKKDVMLSRYATVGTGGKASVFIDLFDIDELPVIYEEAEKRGLRIKVVGNCSNLVFPDEGCEDVILRLSGGIFRKIVYEGEYIKCGAFVSTKKLLDFCIEENISGFEFLAGIPATVGGMIATNAGCFGKSISDYLKEVYVYKHGRGIIKIPREKLLFSYRKTKGLKNSILLYALFFKKSGNKKLIKRKIEKYISRRKKTQPQGKTFGSIFKNPENEKAWKIIDFLGFRGYRVGGIMISEVHANWIVNVGGGTSKDIVKLIRMIKFRAKKILNVKLETEVEIVHCKKKSGEK